MASGRDCAAERSSVGLVNDTVSIVFTINELWLLHACVKHEQSPRWDGHWPITSLDLNDQIAEAIILCEDQKAPDAALMLTRGDLLLLDHNVPQEAQDAAGTRIGKSILLKTFRGRNTLNGVPEGKAKGQELTKDEIYIKTQEWKALPVAEVDPEVTVVDSSSRESPVENDRRSSRRKVGKDASTS